VTRSGRCPSCLDFHLTRPRAAEETLCYRLPDPRTVLARPERLRFTHRATLRAAGRLTGAGPVGKDRRPVSDYLRPVVWCEATEPVRPVAVRMSEAGQSCAVVRLPAGQYIAGSQHLLAQNTVVSLLWTNGPGPAGSWRSAEIADERVVEWLVAGRRGGEPDLDVDGGHAGG